MFALIPASILLVTSISIAVLRWIRPKFPFYWLIGLGGILITWVFNLFLRNWLPIQNPITNWLSEGLFPVSLVLSFDHLSWLISLTLLTFTLSVILTDIVHPVQADSPRSNWFDIAGWISLTALALIAIMAGNLLMVLMTWASLDLMEFCFWLTKAREKRSIEKVVYYFFTRITSLFLIIWSCLLVYSQGQDFSWEGISPQAAIFVLLAVIIRSGVLPINSPIPGELAVARSTRILFRMTGSFVSLMVLPRIAHVFLPAPISSGLLILIGISALTSGFLWLNSKDEIEGLSFWISGVACLSIASAIYNQPTVSIIWMIVLLLSGGVLFCFSVRPGWLILFPIISSLTLSSLPFTPTWHGVVLYTQPISVYVILLLISQSLLLAGYLKHSWHRPSTMTYADRLIWVVLPWGLAQLLILQFLISRWLTLNDSDISTIPITLVDSWPGLAVSILGGFIFFWTLRGHKLLTKPGIIFSQILSIDWIHPMLGYLFRVFSSIFRLVNLFLEGESGVLWAVLVLTLILSLLSQVWSGG